MRTIREAFQEFLQDLELKEGERAEASAQHIYMREQLQQRMDVEGNFLSGSYGRSTAVRPLNDIDIFLVLRPTAVLSLRSPPSAVLGAVKETLEAIYPGKRAKLQARSVNIEFSGTGIAYDVVPAFSRRADVYAIPDRDAPTWIETNPKIHAEMSTQANAQTGTKLKPLIKAVKHANHRHGKTARSFHLEVLSWKVLTADPGAYVDGLAQIFEGLARLVCEPCPDPAGLGPDIRPPLDRCREAQRWLGEMSRLAQEAKGLAADGRTDEAHGVLREIFGDKWPEKGTPRDRRSAAVIVGGAAVDHPGSRFG